MIEVKAFGRFSALGLGIGVVLLVLGAGLVQSSGVVGVIVTFGSALALVLAAADSIRSRRLALRPLAFWTVCLCVVMLAVWSLAAVADPATSDRLRAGVLASTLSGIVIGTFMEVCAPKAV